MTKLAEPNGREAWERATAPGSMSSASWELGVGGQIPREARRWVPIVRCVTRNSLISPALVLAVMHTESGFDPRARSRTGACGLMQLIPGTGARAAVAYLTGRRCQVPEAALFQPELNILLGVAYLEWLWTRKQWRVLPETTKTLVCASAYNAGPNRLSRWLTHLTLAESSALVANDTAVATLVNILHTALRWRETRRFVKAVATRWPRYCRWLGSP